jgi:hypothetical protein
MHRFIRELRQDFFAVALMYHYSIVLVWFHRYTGPFFFLPLAGIPHLFSEIIAKDFDNLMLQNCPSTVMISAAKLNLSLFH